MDQFCGNLSKMVGTTLLPPSLSLKGWNGNFESDFSVKVWRIDLMKSCHVLFFIQFSGDHKCYKHLVDIKWCIMYLVLYPVLKLHVKVTLSYSNKVKKKSTRPPITFSTVLDWCFISEFATIIFIILFWICLLCCVALS